MSWVGAVRRGYDGQMWQLNSTASEKRPTTDVGWHPNAKKKDTKRVITIRKSNKDVQHNDQMKRDKQRSTKHYT